MPRGLRWVSSGRDSHADGALGGVPGAGQLGLSVKDLSLTISLKWLSFSVMTRITGKYQITLPKRLVDAYGIRVGDEVELVAAGRAISILPAKSIEPKRSVKERLADFDQATVRQRAREPRATASEERGWTREDLYTRGRPR